MYKIFFYALKVYIYIPSLIVILVCIYRVVHTFCKVGALFSLLNNLHMVTMTVRLRHFDMSHILNTRWFQSYIRIPVSRIIFKSFMLSFVKKITRSVLIFIERPFFYNIWYIYFYTILFVTLMIKYCNTWIQTAVV